MPTTPPSRRRTAARTDHSLNAEAAEFAESCSCVLCNLSLFCVTVADPPWRQGFPTDRTEAEEMDARSLCATLTAVVLLAGPTAAAQGSRLDSSQASAFMGTWVFIMSNPAGASETVRIWDKNGIVAASVQSGRFPPIDVSGILKDGDMLALNATRCEK